MQKCKSCSAPLLPNQLYCVYCQVRNDLDLQGRYGYSVNTTKTERLCPDCNIPLEVIDVKIKTTNNQILQLDRCQKCYGIFFDPGEIERFMQQSISGFLEINKPLLQNVNRDRYRKEHKVRYRKCPQCQQFMQRKNYAYRSGVVIDRCQQHGIWLDNGELIHLLEWHKSGGKALEEQQKSKHINTSPPSGIPTRPQAHNRTSVNTGGDLDLPGDGLELLQQFIWKLF